MDNQQVDQDNSNEKQSQDSFQNSQVIQQDNQVNQQNSDAIQQQKKDLKLGSQEKQQQKVENVSVKDKILKNESIKSVGKLFSNIFSKTQAQVQQFQHSREEKEIQKCIKQIEVKEAQEQRSFLIESANSKKSTVFESASEWEVNRVEALSAQKQALDSILESVDLAFKQSQDNLQSIKGLVSNITNQIIKRAADYQTLLNQNNEKINSRLYQKISQAVSTLKADSLKKIEFSKQFERSVEEQICNPLIESLKNYQLMIQEERQNLSLVSQQLQDLQTKTQKKYSKLKTVYQENKNAKRPSKDFLKVFYSYLKACKINKDSQEIIASMTLKYWTKVQTLECERGGVIQKAIDTFIELHNQIIINNGVSTSLSPKIVEILQSQNFSEEHIKEQLNFDNILPFKTKIHIAELLGKPIELIPESCKDLLETETGDGEEHCEQKKSIKQCKEELHPKLKNLNISIDEIASVIKIPNYKPFNAFAGLAMKQMNVMREYPRNCFKTSTAIITPDCFLLCYDDEDEQKKEIKQEADQQPSNTLNDDPLLELTKKKPALKMQVNQISLSIYPNELCLIIRELKSSLGFMLNKPTTQCELIFSCFDHLDEFSKLLSTFKEVE